MTKLMMMMLGERLLPLLLAALGDHVTPVWLSNLQCLQPVLTGHCIYNRHINRQVISFQLTLLHSERPKLYTILVFLSEKGLSCP